jgi:hypothetical protein
MLVAALPQDILHSAWQLKMAATLLWLLDVVHEMVQTMQPMAHRLKISSVFSCSESQHVHT